MTGLTSKNAGGKRAHFQIGILILILLFVLQNAAALQESPRNLQIGQSRRTRDLTPEERTRLKEAAEAARNRLAAMAREVTADAEKKREEFIRRNQERLAKDQAKARTGIARLKEFEAASRTSQKRIEEIQIEAAQLMADYRTAESGRRQQIQRRAASLVEELKQIKLASPSGKRERPR
jgi:hypothetical protein